MGRVPRINIKGALYYVTSRGDHEQDLFKSDADYSAYLELLKKYKEQYAFKLFAFVLLPNHIHLLIELTGDCTISQIMHALNSNYTKYFNGRYDRKGHLFQERYKMVIAEKAPYTSSITSYIHEHPVRLGIVKTAGEYKYSSADIAGPSRSMSAEEYTALNKELNGNAILGSKEFIESAHARVEAEKERVAQTGIYKYRNRKVLVIGGSLILAAGIISSYLYIKTILAKQALDKQLVQEKVRIQSMDERYRADKVSYEAMARRLELEKKRVSELEKNIKPTAQQETGPVKEGK